MSNLKMCDFTILTQKETIFDKIDFGQKMSKCTAISKACAKKQVFRARKRSDLVRSKFTTVFFYFILRPVLFIPF